MAPLQPKQHEEGKPKEDRSKLEKALSFFFDGPKNTPNNVQARELRDKWEEDKLDDYPRTKEEEKARQKRIAKRNEITGGGDGVGGKEGREGAMLMRGYGV